MLVCCTAFVGDIFKHNFPPVIYGVVVIAREYSEHNEGVETLNQIMQKKYKDLIQVKDTVEYIKY